MYVLIVAISTRRRFLFVLIVAADWKRMGARE